MRLYNIFNAVASDIAKKSEQLEQSELANACHTSRSRGCFPLSILCVRESGAARDDDDQNTSATTLIAKISTKNTKSNNRFQIIIFGTIVNIFGSCACHFQFCAL